MNGKASQCLPEEDCDFSFFDCTDDVLDTLKNTRADLLIQMQNDIKTLISRTIGAGPGADNGCPPI